MSLRHAQQALDCRGPRHPFLREQIELHRAPGRATPAAIHQHHHLTRSGIGQLAGRFLSI